MLREIEMNILGPCTADFYAMNERLSCFFEKNPPMVASTFVEFNASTIVLSVSSFLVQRDFKVCLYVTFAWYETSLDLIFDILPLREYRPVRETVDVILSKY